MKADPFWTQTYHQQANSAPPYPTSKLNDSKPSHTETSLQERDNPSNYL